MTAGKVSSWLLAASMAVAHGSSTDSLLQLPRTYASARWQKFVEERKSDMETLHAFIKSPKRSEATDGKVGPAVVKVLARCRLPVREVLATFQSKGDVAEWNQFAGEVEHIDRETQLQTYRLPWPFMPRDYLVRCIDRRDKRGHTAHCASVDSDSRVPERDGAVRGHSETVWRFVEEADGGSSIHLETLVDPRGRLPAWLVDKAGKLASVSVVRALVKATYSRVSRASDMRESGAFASLSAYLRRLWGA